MKSPLFKIASLILFLFIQKTWALGPWIGGGGGEGVACFATAEDRQNAFEAQGKLKDSYRSKIQYLYAYDFVEGVPGSSHDLPNPNEDALTYIERLIQTKVEPRHPYVAFRLRQALPLLYWTNKKGLEKIEDSGERGVRLDEQTLFTRHGKLKYCHVLQLAIRYQNPSQDGSFPEVRVEYDRELFERLEQPGPSRVLQQATLILHETIYMMAAELGMKDSSASRNFVQALISGNSDLKKFEIKPEINALVEAFVINTGLFDLADFSGLFLDKTNFPGTLEALRRAHASLLAKRRSLGLIEKFPSRNPPTDLLQNFNSLAQDATLEESYLWMAAFFYKREHSIFTYEHYLLDGSEQRRAELCEKLRHVSDLPNTPTAVLAGKAVRYCNSIQ